MIWKHSGKSSQSPQGGGINSEGGGGATSARDGRKVLPPFLNDLEHDRYYPPEDAMIERLAKILNLSSDVLYFYAKRVPADLRRDAEDRRFRLPTGPFGK